MDAPIWTTKAGASGGLRATLTYDGNPIALDGCVLTCRAATGPGSPSLMTPAVTVVSAAAGEVRIEWTPAQSAALGSVPFVWLELEVQTPAGQLHAVDLGGVRVIRRLVP